MIRKNIWAGLPLLIALMAYAIVSKNGPLHDNASVIEVHTQGF